MEFEKKFANNFQVRDALVEANVDLYGGPSSNCIVLHSIRAIEPIREGINSDRDSLVAYLAEQICTEKKWKSIAVMQNNVVLYSTDNEVRRGDRISSKIRAIDSRETATLGVRSIVQAVRELFRK